VELFFFPICANCPFYHAPGGTFLASTTGLHFFSFFFPHFRCCALFFSSVRPLFFFWMIFRSPRCICFLNEVFPHLYEDGFSQSYPRSTPPAEHPILHLKDFSPPTKRWRQRKTQTSLSKKQLKAIKGSPRLISHHKFLMLFFLQCIDL